MTIRYGAPVMEQHDVAHTCSNCGRQATLDAQSTSDADQKAYSCLTCGQRELVSWGVVPSRVVKDIEVIEEAHIILGEH